MGFTVLQLADKLRCEADAYRFLEEMRWGDGDPVCPHCDSLGASYIEPANGVVDVPLSGVEAGRIHH